MLSNNQLIEYYYQFIVNIVSKTYNKSTANDVSNDISIRLLEMDNDKLNLMHSTNDLERYIARMVRNEYINQKSISNKLYKSDDSLLIDIADEVKDISLIDLDSILTPYELKFITIYSESKSVAEMSRKYKIRRETISTEIKDIQKKIKQTI